MNMPLRPPVLTVEQFEHLPDHMGFELVDGRLKEKGMGLESSEIQCELSFRLKLWVRETRLGVVYESEAMYRCFPNNPDRVRKPDVSFIRRDRLPGGRSPVGVSIIPPDLAAEIVSPNETVYDMNEKIADYQSAEVPLIWIVFPDIQAIDVLLPGSPPQRITVADTLTGGLVLPGFSVPVADLFPPPATT